MASPVGFPPLAPGRDLTRNPIDPEAPSPGPGGRRGRGILPPLLVACAFAALYAATWSGRYFHDSEALVGRVESGFRAHYHLAFFPAGDAIFRVLSAFGPVTPERALEVLSVLSAAATVGLCAALARQATGKTGDALLSAGVGGLTAALWFQGGILEVHGFSAAAASTGALVAYAARLSPALSVPAATLVAMLGHLSCVLLAPAFLALGIAGAAARGRRVAPVEWAAAVGLTGAAVFGARMLLGLALGGHWRAGFAPIVGWLGRVIAEAPAAPGFLARRLWQEFVLGWGLLALSPLALAGLRSRASLPTAALLAASAVPIAWLVAVAPPGRGQYTVILLPFAVLGLAAVAARLPVPRGILAPGLLLLQLGLSYPTRAEWGADPDRRWAATLPERAPGAALILCNTRERRRRAAQALAGTEAALVPADVFNGQGVDGVEGHIEGYLESGRRVYLDSDLFRPDSPWRRFVLELEPRLSLSPQRRAPVVEVLGVLGERR